MAASFGRNAPFRGLDVRAQPRRATWPARVDRTRECLSLPWIALYGDPPTKVSPSGISPGSHSRRSPRQVPLCLDDWWGDASFADVRGESRRRVLARDAERPGRPGHGDLWCRWIWERHVTIERVRPRHSLSSSLICMPPGPSVAGPPISNHLVATMFGRAQPGARPTAKRVWVYRPSRVQIPPPPP